MQLTAAAGQSKQIRKTLMNDCNNFMNEDKRIYIPKGSEKNQNKTITQDPQGSAAPSRQ